MDKDVKKPKITVLMPVYNGQDYIKEAIESILNQTFKNFEFLIIDDGSTDKSAEIIKSYKDVRLKYVLNDRNMGLPYTLNRGIDLAKGEYIARMDADDISYPRRLEKQVAFLDKNPNIAVCGTWIKTFGTGKKELIHKYFTNPDDIKASLLFNTSLAHPSVLMRKSALDKFNLHYEMSYKYFEEDYNLWVELSKHTSLANLPKILLRYRLHNKSATYMNTENRQTGISAIRQKQLERLGLKPSMEDMHLHNSLYPNVGENIGVFLEKEENWLLEIIDACKEKNVYKPEALQKIIYSRWYLLCMTNRKNGFGVWIKFWSSPLFIYNSDKKIIDCIKMFIKILLKK